MLALNWTLVVMLGAVPCLSSCGNGGTHKASSEAFAEVLNAYYADHKDCVGLPTTKNEDGYFYIAEIADDTKPLGAQRNDRDLKPFLALANAGIMTAHDAQLSKKVFSRTEKVAGKGFKLTEVGTSMLLAEEFKRGFSKGEPQLCYGQRVIDEIINFTEPEDIRGFTMSSVNYKYSVGAVADWAKLPEVHLRYPHLETYLTTTSEAKDDLVLSDNGWVHFTEFEQ